jgi:hypothetical protein
MDVLERVARRFELVRLDALGEVTEGIPRCDR